MARAERRLCQHKRWHGGGWAGEPGQAAALHWTGWSELQEGTHGGRPLEGPHWRCARQELVKQIHFGGLFCSNDRTSHVMVVGCTRLISPIQVISPFSKEGLISDWDAAEGLWEHVFKYEGGSAL